MGQIIRELAGRSVVLDDEGFLNDFADWTPEICLALAAESGLGQLDAAHWRVVEFLREYYGTQGRAPLHRELKKGTGLSMLELERLFPGGLKLGARRLAGLPNPKTCA